MSSVSEFPSLPPPIYKPSKLVSLLDCKGLAVREAEHKKWVRRWVKDHRMGDFSAPFQFHL